MGPHWCVRVDVDAQVRTDVDGMTELLPTLSAVWGSWCCRRLDEHQMTSVLAVFSWSRLEHIHVATSSMHADIWSWSCAASVICASSTYKCGYRLHFSTSRNKSAVYSKNSIGPRTDICGSLDICGLLWVIVSSKELVIYDILMTYVLQHSSVIQTAAQWCCMLHNIRC